MIIRRPHPSELEATLKVLDYQIDEQEVTYDENSLLKTVKRHMVQTTHCWLNAYQGTRPVGVIGGCIAEDNWTGERFAMINFFYVLSSHRDQGVYGQLLDEFTQWAKQYECNKVVGGDIVVNYDRVFDQLDFVKKNIWIKE